jgi:hypothetical protein
MKNLKHLLPAFAALLCVTLSCTLLKGRTSNSPYGVSGDLELPAGSNDPNAQFPALSTDVYNALMLDVREAGKHRDKILDAERKLIRQLIAGVENHDSSTFRSIQIKREVGKGWQIVPTAFAATDDPPEMPDMGDLQYYMIGMQIGFHVEDSGKVTQVDRGQHRSEEWKDGSTGTVLATLDVNLDRSTGQVATEVTTTVSVPQFGLSSNSKVKLRGNQCPDEQGKIDLTVEHSSNGRAGSSGSVIYDKTITARVTAIVNDNAELGTATMDFKQATRSTAGGRQIFVESTQSGQLSEGGFSSLQFGDVQIIRASSGVTSSDAEVSKAGLTAAFRLAQGVLDNAERRWKGGGCVMIDAASPGNVAINSTSQISVKVISKVNNTEVPSKLEAKLTGGASVDPTMIPKTSGTLTYIAPGEAGKTATISLTANSRRGRATLDLTASTGRNSYHIAGGLDDFQTSADVCDVTKPFTLKGGGFTVEFSGGIEGTYTYTGPYNAKGDGTYKISLPDGAGKPGSMVGGGSGQITGDKVYSGSGVEKYTLTPIPPCK